MDEKLKIFWNLDVLVKMCRSKSDGPSLRVEEEEILEKISNYETEIEEIRAMLEEDTYDTSAEMADRNIEIITKKQLQSLKAELKEKNKDLNKLKDDESVLYNQTSLLRENKASNEKYITSMQERLSESTDREVLDRYNALITETLTKINELTEELREENTAYEDVQTAILQASADIEDLETRIDKKKKLLAETQTNLENKDNYIDKTKREKNNKKINDIQSKIETLQQRLEDIRKDPKYIETKIKDIINSKEDKENARDYLSELVKIVIEQPYINVPVDNALEEELLRATQARDSFANEIDQKSYNILEANTPEKIRTDFLNMRIENWKDELDRLHKQISLVDRDTQYNYEEKDRQLEEMIRSLKNDLREFEKAYADTADTNIGAKASLEVALEEKKEDIQEAEKIANAFKTNEAEDIANATRTIKYQCEMLNNQIREAEEEIKRIRNRLMSRKSGLIDIAARNKDKDVLKNLAQTVVDIKHRRQFPETPFDIIKRLEEELDIRILTQDDLDTIERTSVIEAKNYDEFITKKYEVPEEQAPEEEVLPIDDFFVEDGKELTDVDIMNPEDLIESSTDEEFQKLADQAMGVENTEEEPTVAPIDEIEEPLETEETPVEESTVEETPAEESAVEESPVEESTVEEEPVEEVEEEPTEETVPETTEETTNESTEEEPEEVTEENIEETPNEEDETSTVEEEPIEEESTEEEPAIEEEPEEEIITEEVEEEPTEETVPETTEETTEEVSEEVEVPTDENEESVETEESVEENPVEESTVEEEPVEEVVEEIEEPVTEEIVEETPVEEVVEEVATEPVETEKVVEETPVNEETGSEEVEEPQAEDPSIPLIEENQSKEAESTTDENSTDKPSEIQENPFGDAINPLEQEEPTTAPQEDIVELSSNIDDDLSINSMFSNSIELSDEKDNEEVRNNLSNELDSFLNNLDDKNE